MKYLKHDKYNYYLVNKCRNLRLKWSGEENGWEFTDLVEDKFDEINDLFNNNIVTVEIAVIKCGWRDYIYGITVPVTFCGYTIARAFNRDSGAKLGDGVAMLSGEISSGGSSKNWETIINVGSVFRLKMSKNLLDKYGKKEPGEFEYKII